MGCPVARPGRGRQGSGSGASWWPHCCGEDGGLSRKGHRDSASQWSCSEAPGRMAMGRHLGLPTASLPRTYFHSPRKSLLSCPGLCHIRPSLDPMHQGPHPVIASAALSHRSLASADWLDLRLPQVQASWRSCGHRSPQGCPQGLAQSGSSVRVVEDNAEHSRWAGCAQCLSLLPLHLEQVRYPHVTGGEAETQNFLPPGHRPKRPRQGWTLHSPHWCQGSAVCRWPLSHTSAPKCPPPGEAANLGLRLSLKDTPKAQLALSLDVLPRKAARGGVWSSCGAWKVTGDCGLGAGVLAPLERFTGFPKRWRI